MTYSLKVDDALINAITYGDLKNFKEILQNYPNAINRDIDDSCGLSPIFLAVIHKKIDIVKLLLEEFKVNPNTRNNLGYTVLHEAIFKNEIRISKLLLEYGGDPLLFVDNASESISGIGIALKMDYWQIIEMIFSFDKFKEILSLHHNEIISTVIRYKNFRSMRSIINLYPLILNDINLVDKFGHIFLKQAAGCKGYKEFVVRFIN